MSDAYDYFDERCDGSAVEISRQDIEQCESVEDLLAWRDGFSDLKSQVQADFEARTFTGTATAEWVHRVSQKLAYLGMGSSRVDKRLRALGYEPSPLGKTIAKLNEKIAYLKAEVAYAQAFVLAASGILPSEALARVSAAAIAAMPGKSEGAQ